MISAIKNTSKINELAETKIQQLKKKITIKPMEAIFIFNTDENKIVYSDGWGNLTGKTKQNPAFKAIISSISCEYQNFSTEIIEKSIAYYKIQKVDLLDHWCQFDLKILHKNGTSNPVIAKISAFELNSNGQLKSIIVRFTVNQALRLGKAIRFKAFNDGKNSFEDYLNSQLNFKNRISGTEVELVHSLINGIPYQTITETVCNNVSKIEEIMQSLLSRFNVRSKHGLLDFAFENFLLPNHSYS
jgi:hypothetical protein